MSEKLIGVLKEQIKLSGKLLDAPLEVHYDDHNKLNNRDLPDQHPISAITNLEEELTTIKQTADVNYTEISKELINIKETATNNYDDLSKKINNKIRTAREIPDDLEVGQYIFLEVKEAE